MSAKLNIPETWELAALGEICSIVTDGTHKTPNYVDNGIPFISIANIRPFEPINFNKYVKYITKEDHIELCKKAKPGKGDILFPRIGTLGYAKRIDFDYEVSIFVGLGLAKPFKDFISSKYLEFYMNTHWVNKFSFENATGTGRLTLPLEASRILPIPIPPLSEQQRIVAKIEELFSSLDKGIESLKTAQQQLKVYRQAVLKWAFEGKLTNKNVVEGQLPEGWSECKISDIAQTFGGYAFKSGDFKQEGKYQVLRMGNIRPGVLRYDESPIFLNNVDENVLKKALLKPNDVIITQTGTKAKRDYGFTVLIPKTNLLLNQRIAAIRCNDKCVPKFFLYYTWTDKFKNQFFANETGNVGQGNVGMKAVTDTIVYLPDLPEQQIIVAKIESRLSVCDKIEESIEQSLKQSESLRQSILKKAFEGKLVPQDPNEEPASKLLERIKVEKESLKRK